MDTSVSENGPINDKSGSRIVWVIFRLQGSGENGPLLINMLSKKKMGILVKRHISIPNLPTKLIQKKIFGLMISKYLTCVRHKIWPNNTEFQTF